VDKVQLKEKAENFWYYYKVHTIVVVVLIVIVTIGILSAVSRKDSALNVTILGHLVNDEKRQNLQNEVTSKLIKNSKQEISLNFMAFDKDSKDEASIAVVQKIVAMVSMKDLDILIADREVFDSYAKQGMFLRLDTVNGLSMLKNNGIKFINSRAEGKDTEDVPYGIDVADNKILLGMDYDSDNKVLGIVANTKRMDLTLQFLKWMFGISG
jgi:hypothetical protein